MGNYLIRIRKAVLNESDTTVHGGNNAILIKYLHVFFSRRRNIDEARLVSQVSC